MNVGHTICSIAFVELENSQRKLVEASYFTFESLMD